MSPGMQALDDEIAESLVDWGQRSSMGYNGSPDRKQWQKRAVVYAQARVDAALAALVPDDKLLDARLLELANVLDGTIDPVEYMRPRPPPMRPSRVDNTNLNRLIQQMAEQARRPR